MAGNRFRYVDYWHSRFLNASSQESRAADEIIAEPERHLLSQNDLFAAEGGVAGLLAQVGVVGASFAALFIARPKLLTYLRHSQLRASEWTLLAGTGYVGYRVGYSLGNSFFGDAEKVNNHWLAYFYQKQLNRFEGRQILSKAPGNY
jgi:hypothetical protein